MTSTEIIALADRYLMPTYARAPLAFVRGEGARAVGRRRPGVPRLLRVPRGAPTSATRTRPIVDAIDAPGRDSSSTSRTCTTASRRRASPSCSCTHSFADRVFLCNSGAEANEAAIKLARTLGPRQRRRRATRSSPRSARSTAARSRPSTATGQEKVRVGFEPLPPGFRYVPYDDVAALEARPHRHDRRRSCSSRSRARAASSCRAPSYLAGAARRSATERGVLLILDEIQTGMGRTGTLFAYEQSGIVPDVMTLAKALGERRPDRRHAGARATIADVLRRRARTARRSAATPSPAPRPWRRSRRIDRDRLPRRRAAQRASALRAGLERSPRRSPTVDGGARARAHAGRRRSSTRAGRAGRRRAASRAACSSTAPPTRCCASCRRSSSATPRSTRRWRSSTEVLGRMKRDLARASSTSRAPSATRSSRSRPSSSARSAPASRGRCSPARRWR